MAKKVKLGEKANSFFDPSSQLKVLPGDVIELKNVHQKSKKVTRALAGGHLVYTSDSPNKDAKAVVEKAAEETSWVEEQELETGALMKLKVAELAEVAKHYGTEIEEEELLKMKKAELVDEIFELTEESEEEEDEDDEE